VSALGLGRVKTAIASGQQPARPVGFAPDTRHIAASQRTTLWAISCHEHVQQKNVLFDHLVGAAGRRDDSAKRTRSLAIDDEFLI
jgi:hypothetical protein